jgi:hypothetical protein
LATKPIESIETSLVIHPRVLERFEDYCDFLKDAERLVKGLGLRGVIQIASFHPDYEFANTEPNAIENYTNRSPYPMLHLLREESITKIAAKPDDLLQIPMRNVAVLRQLGRKKLLNLIQAADADSRKRKHAIQEVGAASPSRHGHSTDALCRTDADSGRSNSGNPCRP